MSLYFVYKPHLHFVFLGVFENPVYMPPRFITHVLIAVFLVLLANTVGLEYLSPFHLNCIFAFVLVWVTGDGVLLANDLRWSEERVRDFEGQLNVLHRQIHFSNMNNSEYLKKLDENHRLMLEIRSRILRLRNKKNTQILPSSTAPLSLDVNSISGSSESFSDPLSHERINEVCVSGSVNTVGRSKSFG